MSCGLSHALSLDVLLSSDVYAYYEEDDAKRELFEFLQRDLEIAVENLAYPLSRTPTGAVRQYDKETILRVTRDAERVASEVLVSVTRYSLTCLPVSTQRRQHIMETEPASPLISNTFNQFAMASSSSSKL